MAAAEPVVDPNLAPITLTMREESILLSCGGVVREVLAKEILAKGTESEVLQLGQLLIANALHERMGLVGQALGELAQGLAAARAQASDPAAMMERAMESAMRVMQRMGFPQPPRQG